MVRSGLQELVLPREPISARVSLAVLSLDGDNQENLHVMPDSRPSASNIVPSVR